MQNLVSIVLAMAITLAPGKPITRASQSPNPSGAAALVCRIAVDNQHTWCECRGTAPGYRIYRPHPMIFCQLVNR